MHIFSFAVATKAITIRENCNCGFYTLGSVHALQTYGPISGRGCLLDEPASQWEACIYIHTFATHGPISTWGEIRGNSASRQSYRHHCIVSIRYLLTCVCNAFADLNVSFHSLIDLSSYLTIPDQIWRWLERGDKRGKRKVHLRQRWRLHGMYDGERDTEVSKMILEHSILGHPACRYHSNLLCLCRVPTWAATGTARGSWSRVTARREPRTTRRGSSSTSPSPSPPSRRYRTVLQ